MVFSECAVIGVRWFKVSFLLVQCRHRTSVRKAATVWLGDVTRVVNNKQAPAEVDPSVGGQQSCKGAPQ